MILISDSGATKASWCLINDGEVCLEFTSVGINAALTTQKHLAQRIATDVMPQLFSYVSDIKRVYFYGAGCVPDVCTDVKYTLKSYFVNAAVEVHSDMLGVCRALCGNQPGVVCILGTGANSCLYDGQKITDNVPALGYILGDEGSGAYLGKMLVSDVFKRQLPIDICKEFLERYDLDVQKVVQSVYRSESPSRFLASFTPFLKEKISDTHIHNLVAGAFRAFFDRNVCAYDYAKELTQVYFCGSIAYYFKDILTDIAKEKGINIGGIVRQPMEGLIKYHSL